MPILSKTTALTVYKAEHIPTEADIRKYAFQPIDQAADEFAFGTVNIDDYLDLTWEKSLPQKGNFMVFGLRVDTRRVPGAVVKKHLAQALKEERKKRAEAGKTFIPKWRKTEVKDQIMLRLRAKAEPVPTVFDVVVDMTSKTVFFTSSSKKPKKYLETLWMAMCGEALVEQTPAEIAGTVNSDLSLMTTAEDFLTMILNEGLAVGDKTVFTVPAKATLTSQVKKAVVALDIEPGHTELSELTAPMADRKAVKATLEIEGDAGQFTMTVRASDFGITGLKTPKVSMKPVEGEDPDGAFLEKLHLIGQVVGELFAAYRDSVPRKSPVLGEDF